MYMITSLFLSLLNICLKTVSILSSQDIRQEGFWSSSQNRIVDVVFIVYAMGLKTSPNNLRDCHILIVRDFLNQQLSSSRSRLMSSYRSAPIYFKR